MRLNQKYRVAQPLRMPSVLNPRLILLMAAGLSVVLSGCAGQVRYPNYYTLHVAPAADPPDPPGQARPVVSVAVREFRAPGYLRQGPIVFHSSPEQLGFYEYHRWAVDPREFVTNTISDRLRASGRFAVVKIYDGRADVDYILSGTLDKLEEVDDAQGARVEVALTAQVIDFNTGSTVWAGSASESAQVTQRDVPGVVAQMSKTLDLAIDKLLSPIPAAIDTTRKPGAGR